MTPLQVAPGQVWAPNARALPGVGPVRVICRYVFHTNGKDVIWVVEHLNHASKIERVAEETLRSYWCLSENVRED